MKKYIAFFLAAAITSNTFASARAAPPALTSVRTVAVESKEFRELKEGLCGMALTVGLVVLGKTIYNFYQFKSRVRIPQFHTNSNYDKLLANVKEALARQKIDVFSGTVDAGREGFNFWVRADKGQLLNIDKTALILPRAPGAEHVSILLIDVGEDELQTAKTTLFDLLKNLPISREESDNMAYALAQFGDPPMAQPVSDDHTYYSPPGLVRRGAGYSLSKVGTEVHNLTGQNTIVMAIHLRFVWSLKKS